MTDTEPPAAEIRAGEAVPIIGIAQARIVGSQAFVVVYQFLGLLGGMLLSGLVAGLLPWLLYLVGIEAGWDDQWLVSVAVLIQLIGAVMGFAIGFNAAARRHAAKFLAAVKARGTPDTLRFTYTIEPDALLVASDRISHRLTWHAILEVMRAPEHWLFQVDTLTIILPRRAFDDEQAERDFVRTVLERITPEARERSGEAAAFAG
jgi:hypothetical protein